MTESFIRIGLVMEHSLAFYRQILRGIKTFASDRPDWLFTPIAANSNALELVKPLRCHGYIAHIFHRPLAQKLRSLRRPVINVSGVLPDLPFPRVVEEPKKPRVGYGAGVDRFAVDCNFGSELLISARCLMLFAWKTGPTQIRHVEWATLDIGQ